MGEPVPGTPLLASLPESRLDSWKEIAAYLNRDVTTVQRWEKREGMPVHRHVHDKRGSVYALPLELDAWLRARRPNLEGEEKTSEVETPMAVELAVSQRASRTRLWQALAMTAAIGVLAAAFLAFRRRAGDTVPPKIHSLAVLPLKNLSGDPSQDYLADGMTEALIGRLAGIHDLRVISHTSVMRFKNPQLSATQIGKTLGVDALVEGSVTREGNHIRVTAQLIRAATDDHFWSETYDREFGNALSLESELAQSIAEKVEVTVTGEEQERLAAARPVAPEVYESYLKGRFAYRNDNSRADIEESIRHFNDAIKQDSTFAPAYLGLANAYDELGTVFIGASPQETRRKVLAYAEKALELDPNLADAHVLLADVQQKEWHWARAEAEYKQALQLNPNDASAYAGFANWLLCEGRTGEAIDWAQRGRALDPLAVSGNNISWILFSARRYDEAIRELRSTLAVQPNDASSLWYLGFVLVADHQPVAAIPVLEKTLSVSKGSSAIMGVLIHAYAQAGRRADALRMLAELKRRSRVGYVPAAAFVNAYLGLGEKDQTFAWLEKAYNEQSNMLQFLKVHPFFDPLRSDPRFADLVRRVGLAQGSTVVDETGKS